MDENVLRKEAFVDENWIWDWPFENKEELKTKTCIKPISQKDLLNKLNHLHFTGNSFQVFFQDTNRQKSMLLQAKIKSCSETTLTCICFDQSFNSINTRDYHLTHVAIDDGKNLILMPASLLSNKNDLFIINLPEIGYEINQRQARRHLCHDINVKLSQDGLECKGMLLDFSSFDCRVQLKHAISLEKKSPINISFHQEGKLLYLSKCDFIRENDHPQNKEIVLKFLQNSNSISTEQKIIRNPRLNLTPAPSINFEHPLIKKRFQLEIENISSSGFCVYESIHEGILLDGLIISRLEINFFNVFKIYCMAKVVNRTDENLDMIHYGFSIIDMDMKAYSDLNKIIAHALDNHSFTNNEINSETLWDLFFKSNFIYPQKYQHIQSVRNEIKKTYCKLYEEGMEIANHFTYQKNGIIYGHISVLRAYEKTWLMHHHMAKTLRDKPVGFVLLLQLMYYFMGMDQLPSLNTKYLIGYYRPENRFPARVFGGMSQHAGNREISSIDLFAYLEYPGLSLYNSLPSKWSLRPCTLNDLKILHQFYNEQFGGLLLEAMGISCNDCNFEKIETIYKNLGLLRKLKVYCLGIGQDPHAILIIDQSNPGLNLSDLLNNIKVIIIRHHDLEYKILKMALAQLIHKYRLKDIPILIFPFDYVKINKIDYDKQYQFMVYKISHVKKIAEYFKEQFKLSYWN